MAEFKLGRIKFVWKGEWSDTTEYYVDDVVNFGGKAFICVVGHTSDADFYTDLNIVPSRWNLLVDGSKWRGAWTTSEYYVVNDLVRYGGNLYICNTPHTSAATLSSGLEANSGSWTLYGEGLEWKNNWTPSTRYKVNDLVRYGGYTYVCNTAHTSIGSYTSGLELDIANWDVFNPGVEYKGDWNGSSVRYKVNDVVKYGAGLWVCTTGHTSTASFITDEPNWDQFVEAIEFEGNWNISTVYQPGDVVRYGGNQYISRNNHVGQNPVTSLFNWDLYSEGFNYADSWSLSTSYKVGDVVTLNGYVYLAIADSPSTTYTVTASTASSPYTFTTSSTNGMVANMAISFSGTTFGTVNNGATYYLKTVPTSGTFTVSQLKGGTTFQPSTAAGSMTATVAAMPPNTSYWKSLVSGVYWKGEWADDTQYVEGDAVRYGSNAFICVLAHRSEGDDGSTIKAEGGGAALSRPDLDFSGTYWNTLNVGSETSVLTTKGDIAYFGASGPTRLPVGRWGQVLRAGEEYPEWVTLGEVDHAYFVAPHGTDNPAPVFGKTWDMPWKTVRYAAEQIEKGPRNPDAQKLLEMNRVFIQREVTKWIDYQVNYYTNTSPDPLSKWFNFDYDEYKCERDTGFLIDRLIWDIGHGGNLKMRAAAQAYVNALAEGPYSTGEDENGTGTYSRLSIENDNDVEAFEYMLTVVDAVLNNEAPASNYQVLMGDTSTATVSQFFDTDLVAEAGVMDTITDLVHIVTDTITAGTTDNLPARDVPSDVINVAPGTFEETLPIIVPAECAVVGSEVRATHVKPTGNLFDISDVGPSVNTFGRINIVVGQVITGATVTPTTGNTSTQSQEWPYATSDESTLTTSLINVMKYQADYRTGAMEVAFYPDPTNYNTSYLIGYGDARKLLKENKKFLQEQVVAYLEANYATSKYGKTKTRRDVGYIVDALIYDLTYGGNSQSIVAGLAYYDSTGSTNLIPASIKTLTLASINYLKTIAQDVAQNNTVTTNQTVRAQYRDTAGSVAAATLIGANIDIVYNLINGGNTTSAPSITVTTITGTDTLATATNHGLAAGDTFTPRSTANGLTSGVTYYVLSSGLTATQFKVSTSFTGSAATLSNGSGLSIVGDVVNYGGTSWASYTSNFNTLSAQIATIGTNAAAAIATAYPGASYDSTKSARDVRLVLQAVGRDFIFDSNYATLKAALAYLRANAVELYTTENLKTYTRYALNYAKTQAKLNVGGDATVQNRIETLMTLVDDMIFGAYDEGDMCQSELRTRDYAALQLERNRDFIVEETRAHIENTFKTTCTDTTVTTNRITCSSTSWMRRGMSIQFTGTIPSGAGINTGTVYYVQKIISSTQFTVSATAYAVDSHQITLATKSGSWTAKMYYNQDLCLRDVGLYIDALKWDLRYSSNYKSRYVSRYYANAIMGSHEEDMFYMRNGTGLRNMTLEGLDGNLTPENSYGTSRTTAGAYASLDPGWGPADFRTWIISRSPYLQNCACFGYAAIGQKIDGALHNGGNQSMVSNDFTQLISDGIGAWVTNNGRAELVSVFTYYSHLGYLSEAGGRIRGTNGNNSYGDFGSVAEGYDATETPGTAQVNTKAYAAVVGHAFTDGDNEFLIWEFDNAGADYTEATWVLAGPGTGAVVETDEFRDDAVFEVFLLDNVDDSTNAPEAAGNFGGYGYVTNSNTAQAGTSTQITIAATDSENSTAYVGMKIYLTGGTGAGQYGIIATYNSGTKVATVTKETTGASGWDHLVPGQSITAPDASTTYTIEPRIQLSAPGYTSTAATLPTSGTWTAVRYGETCAAYTSLTGTYSGTTGSGATWQVTRNGWRYFVTNVSGGTKYNRLETITISGANLGGATPTNDIVITITTVNSVTGAIVDFDFSGYGIGGRYVAVRSGSQIGATSEDGITWDTRTTLMPSGANWTAIATGVIDDGSSVAKVSRFMAVAGTGSATTASAWSADGITWTATTMKSSAQWCDIAYGAGNFVAINSDTTSVNISGDGEVWDITGTLPGTGFTNIAYGKGKFVVIGPGAVGAAYSTNGGVTWTTVAMPASTNYSGLTYGNNRFVAVSSTSGTEAAYSLDGITWTAATLPATASWQDVIYGQGLFFAVSATTQAASSEDGINWTSRTTSTAASGFSSICFGNRDRYGLFVGVGGSTGTVATYIRTGATAKARAYVAENKIYSIKMLEPGSGYNSLPTVTITDPSKVFEAPTLVRKGKSALATPSFRNRGTGFVSASVELDTGDGYADFLGYGTLIPVKRISQVPVPGSNVVFANLPNETYKLVNVFTLVGANEGSQRAFFQVSPEVKRYNYLADESSLTTRIRYSQVRLTGHDFLLIGTGSFDETNYPNTPTQDPIPANETVESNGGRVFYTSTDQDGNFRVGGLFTVEQSTGIATLNADAFNIAGLQELSLGNITLGGGSATITEFSTDPFFTADSDTVVPTQRAVKAYISSQIGGGGASLNVNSVTAGSIYIAGTQISTVTNVAITMQARVNFQNSIRGYPVAWNFYMR